MQDDDTLSLRHQLVNWLFTPLFLLLLFSTVTGYMAAVNLSNKPYDLVLLERAKLLASRYMLHGENASASHLGITFPRMTQTRFATRCMMLTVASWLPAASCHHRARPTSIKSNRACVTPNLMAKSCAWSLCKSASKWRDHAGPGRRTGASTADLGRSILGNIVIPQLMFIVIAGIAVWIGLKRGFEPLDRLRQEVAARPRNDLRPLDETRAPGEVRPLIQEVNALIVRLQAMMDTQRRFIADAAHQLRTPFAGLKAQAELAKREQVAEPVREALERICDSAQRCSHLVTQLLTLARNEPEARRNAACRNTRSASSFAGNRRALGAGSAAKEYRPRLSRRTGPMIPARGDEASLRDLLDNLIDNAIRYTPGGGRITVRAGGQRRQPLAGSGRQRARHSRPARCQVFERFHRIPGNNNPAAASAWPSCKEVAIRHGARWKSMNGQDGGRCSGSSFPPSVEVAANSDKSAWMPPCLRLSFELHHATGKSTWRDAASFFAISAIPGDSLHRDAPLHRTRFTHRSTRYGWPQLVRRR
jgi:two-component system, OmpR family, sensor histidine kinase TctE